MLPIILAGTGFLALREIIVEWNWTRDCDKHELSNLPATPGAYILYNRYKKIIHIGSTGNLYQRLNGHEKRRRIHTFDFYEANSSQHAYEKEMKLHKDYDYKGR